MLLRFVNIELDLNQSIMNINLRNYFLCRNVVFYKHFESSSNSRFIIISKNDHKDMKCEWMAEKILTVTEVKYNKK